MVTRVKLTNIVDLFILLFLLLTKILKKDKLIKYFKLQALVLNYSNYCICKAKR